MDARSCACAWEGTLYVLAQGGKAAQAAVAAKAAAALKCFCKEEGGRERFSYPPHFPLKNLLWLAVLKMTP